MDRDISFDGGTQLKRKREREGGGVEEMEGAEERKRDIRERNIHRPETEKKLNKEYVAFHSVDMSVCVCASRVSTYEEVIQLNTIVAFNL